LDKDVAAKAFAEGKEMTMEQAIAYALEEVGPGGDVGSIGE
jgi:hypothetical protein